MNVKIRNMILTATGAAMTIFPAAGAFAHESHRAAHEVILTHPIADANKDYKKEVREKGCRVGRVTVGQ